MDPKHFKQLQKEWYKKLKNSGFEDIEDSRGRIKDWWRESPYQEDLLLLPQTTQYRASATEYYRLAAQYYYSKKFPSLLHKRVWKRHSLGFTLMEIADQLKLTVKQVQYSVEKMREEFFGIKRGSHR